MGIRFSAPARVLKHAIEKFVEMTSEVWKGFNQNSRLYNSSGEDSVPCKDDQIILVKIDGTGKYIAAGVLTVSQGAKPGEKIFYARDADSKTVSKISMLNDGSVTVDTDTETTGEANGNYNRIIKGKTDILEKDSRTYENKKDVTNTILGNKTETVEKDVTENAKGSRNIETDKDYVINGKENVTVEAVKKNTFKGADVEINGKTVITGATLKCDEVAVPNGTGCWCGIPFCTWNGAPQTGNLAAGT